MFPALVLRSDNKKGHSKKKHCKGQAKALSEYKSEKKRNPID